MNDVGINVAKEKDKKNKRNTIMIARILQNRIMIWQYDIAKLNEHRIRI